jgi:[acyl-carrier-protein] S-malonyltransferase
MGPAEQRLRADLDAVPISAPQISFYNNVDARKVTSADDVRDGLARQVSRAVRWTELVERLVADEQVRTVVELGPGTVLSNMIKRIDRTVERLTTGDAAGVDALRTRFGP